MSKFTSIQKDFGLVHTTNRWWPQSSFSSGTRNVCSNSTKNLIVKAQRPQLLTLAQIKIWITTKQIFLVNLIRQILKHFGLMRSSWMNQTNANLTVLELKLKAHRLIEICSRSFAAPDFLPVLLPVFYWSAQYKADCLPIRRNKSDLTNWFLKNVWAVRKSSNCFQQATNPLTDSAYIWLTLFCSE